MYRNAVFNYPILLSANKYYIEGGAITFENISALLEHYKTNILVNEIQNKLEQQKQILPS